MGRGKGKNRGPVRARDSRTHEVAQTTTPAKPAAKAASHAVQTPAAAATGPGASGLSRAQDLAQQRAKHAWEAVQAASALSDKDAKDFGGQAKKLPMRIRAAGLGQALAFVRAKAKPSEKDDKKKHHGHILLLEQLGGWVLHRLGEQAKPDPVRDDTVLKTILNNDATFLRRATLEAMAWLEWVNRFAEAEGLGDDQDTE